ncbi:hypothetical protein BDV38DRAFT_247565 [Aspergillus pseudotamarii]|uniref:Uncharacterized protein n=1 Tax=Aspergillus pseudotamarii TaxID=132259 RepID=A0A5N6SU03_ASPPS|nr:uncharacterized protein BDV38DRAFT_247565 [Aspergillus pseudotamarii]KAE8137220.1 hypothetical protein BDV38DRAFT_247565 [Aspergillus pseudotamarii]
MTPRLCFPYFAYNRTLRLTLPFECFPFGALHMHGMLLVCTSMSGVSLGLLLHTNH